MSDEDRPYYTVNGDTVINGETYWVVVNVAEGRTGLDFLAHPFALIRSFEEAGRFVELLNA